jgi:hypothetical protein
MDDILERLKIRQQYFDNGGPNVIGGVLEEAADEIIALRTRAEMAEAERDAFHQALAELGLKYESSLAEAHQRGQSEGMEEASRIAEQLRDKDRFGDTDGFFASDAIVDAIRAKAAQIANQSNMFRTADEQIEAMTPEERWAKIEAQREGIIRGTTTACQHGLLSFNKCPKCSEKVTL